MNPQAANRVPIDEQTLRDAVAGTRWRSVRVVEETGSTNADLVALAASTDSVGSVLVAEHQSAGRGRHARHWVSPPRTQVAMSVAVAADSPGAPAALGWLPLLTGLAVVEGIRAVSDLAPVLKWPNDVLLPEPGGTTDGVGGRKVCGILAELTRGPSGSVAIIGMGINVSLTEAELPVPTAISLDLAGADVSRKDLAAAVLTALSRRLQQWPQDLDGLRRDYRDNCVTLGHQVRVELPLDEQLVGAAVEIDNTGRVVVDAAGKRVAVAAGDVTHLRITD
jgi:BirA family transcriptional regulator, biotin operon repressor / biotin---[acetyl-CoA-carboxylase] ligase